MKLNRRYVETIMADLNERATAVLGVDALRVDHEGRAWIDPYAVPAAVGYPGHSHMRAVAEAEDRFRAEDRPYLRLDKVDGGFRLHEDGLGRHTWTPAPLPTVKDGDARWIQVVVSGC